MRREGVDGWWQLKTCGQRNRSQRTHGGAAAGDGRRPLPCCLIVCPLTAFQRPQRQERTKVSARRPRPPSLFPALAQRWPASSAADAMTPEAQGQAPADAHVLSPRSPVVGAVTGRAPPEVVGTLTEADLEVLRSKKVAVFGSFQVRGRAGRCEPCIGLAAVCAQPPCRRPWSSTRVSLPALHTHIAVRGGLPQGEDVHSAAVPIDQ